MSQPDLIEDLSRWLATHRAGEVIEQIRQTPPDSHAALAAEIAERVAGVLACASAEYASRLLAAAASFEHLADATGHPGRRHP